MARRLYSAARWLAPSAACACAGALAAGGLEAVGASDVVGAAATAGFLALIVLPALVAASAIARGLYAAWQPRALAIVEDDGGAPVLAGWLVVVLLGCLLLAWAMFQGTWLLNAWTAFKPLTLSFALPVIAVAAALVAVAASRPAARLFAAFVRAVDRKLRRGDRSLLAPRRVVAGAAVAAAGTAYALWRLMVKPKLGPLDTSVLHAPALGVIVLLAAHAVWPRLARARRAIAGGVLAAAAAAAIASALVAVHTRPSLTLEIWGDQPLAGLAIERLFDLDDIRARISLAEFRPVDKPGSPHPDLVLITIDTVRADHTPPYGGTADMPILRELGARGAVFLHAFAPSNVTRRSIPSIVTGLQPNRVRGRVVGWALRIDPRHVLLAERLRAGGYETAGFMCCKGFWGSEARTGLSRGLEHLEIEQSGMRLAKAARAWLDARERIPAAQRRPLFLWMHILEPHNWTGGVTEPTTETDRRRMYDRSLTAADGVMREVVGAFVERTPELAPIFVVTADHGEALGDHGAPYHSTDLYDSQIRVPLVVTGPGIKPVRIAETVSLTDLTPTLVELAGFQPPANLDGRSIADLATGARLGNPDDGIAFAAMIKDRSNPGGVTAVVRGGWKLIDNGVSYELYDVKNDPGERQNLYAQHPARAAELKRLLAERTAERDPF